MEDGFFTCFTSWTSVIGNSVRHKVTVSQYFQEIIHYVVYFGPFGLQQSTLKKTFFCIWVTSVWENYNFNSLSLTGSEPVRWQDWQWVCLHLHVLETLLLHLSINKSTPCWPSLHNKCHCQILCVICNHHLFQNNDIFIWWDILGEVVSINDDFLVRAALSPLHIEGRIVSVVGEQIVMNPTFKWRSWTTWVGMYGQSSLIVPYQIVL